MGQVQKEIELLVSYLPKLYAVGFKPVKHWDGGYQEKDGAFIDPEPVYEMTVSKFFKEAGREFWTDYNYIPEEAGELIQNEKYIQSAALQNIKTLLTYCVRGERFSDGHWGAMIEKGYIRQLLERLIQIQTEVF